MLTGLGTAGHKLGELAHLHPGAPPAPEKGPSEAAARAAEEARLAGEHALQQMVTVVHIVAANDNLLGQQQPEALEALRDAMGMMQELQRSLAAIRWAAAGQGRLASMAHSLMDYLQAIDERLFVEGLMADSQREAAGRRFHTTAEGLLRAAEEAVLGGMVGGGQKLAEAARDLGLSGVGGGIGAAAPPAPPGPAEAEQPKSVAQAGAQLLRRIGWAIKGASSGAWSRARTAGRGAVMGATSVGHVLAWPIRLAGQPLLTSMKGKPGGVSRPAVSRVEEEEGMAAMPWPPAELQAGPGQPLQASVAQALPPTAATAHALHELAEVQRYIQDMQELIGHEGGGSSSSSRKRT